MEQKNICLHKTNIPEYYRRVQIVELQGVSNCAALQKTVSRANEQEKASCTPALKKSWPLINLL